jgi:hypothetical protein
MVAYLCCIGWLEVNSMMASVNVGFLKMPVLKPVGVLCMVRSRKFSVQLSSVSAVNWSLGCKELKSFSIFFMSDWLGSYIIRMSSA